MSNSFRQSLEKRKPIDPPFHFVLLSVLVVNLAFATFHMVHHWNDTYSSYDSYFASRWYFVLSLAAFIPFIKLRSYPLKVQNRVIRLEERLRLQALAPAKWHPQIYRLTEDQLIGLRYAADDEVVELAKLALIHNWNSKQIKERIQDWRADNWRI
jgi:hypothetical protein